MKPVDPRDFEILGQFYLGRVYDLVKDKETKKTLLYDSKDLTTHAVCVGMTGSGKTGLCIDLLEEAAMDRIPSIVIDPKGDMTNLMLTFPALAPGDFRPWIDEGEAAKQNKSPDTFAVEQAEIWKKGLAAWDQTPDRIKRLRENAEFRVYTPGSQSGIPVSVLDSFSAPPASILDDEDLFQERISTTVSGLLGLVGITTDPIRSREHILLSTLFDHFWKQKKTLDLPTLIRSVQNPPVGKMGVLDMESFYPSKERFELAMVLNNLLASPSFQIWLQGEPLDVQNFLYSETGKPRVSIFTIAHLSDAERMFFVSLLLNQILGWVRTQPGTSSLRALLYFDEIFGYLPPVQNPASKRPLLTLLKQARAFGFGVVLVTQNPVDLDYKGLSNAGTWLIGRLQTERDRDRLLDGLLSASGTGDSRMDRSTLGRTISGLKKRVFLLHNINDKRDEVFATGWAMSYLCGPLTRNQIKLLPQSGFAEGRGRSSTEAKALPAVSETTISENPVLHPSVQPWFVPVRVSQGGGESLMYRPFVFGCVKVHYTDRSAGLDIVHTVRRITPIRESAVPVDWDQSFDIGLDQANLERSGKDAAKYEAASLTKVDARRLAEWEKAFEDFVAFNLKCTLFKSTTWDMVSQPGETEQVFRIRLSQKAREGTDEWAEKSREKYSQKFESLQAKLRRLDDQLEKEQSQARQQKFDTAISLGATLLGAFLGRKGLSSSTVNRAGTAMRKAGRSAQETQDVKRVQENRTFLEGQIRELEDRFQKEVSERSAASDPMKESLEVLSVLPKKSGLSMILFGFLWAPYWIRPDNTMVKAW